MSWPDDGQPRYVLDPRGLRVLDRAYCHQVVSSPRLGRDRTTLLAATLNRNDRP